MSFVDLLGNDVWSEADIVNRTEAMVQSITSTVSQQIINRKVTAAMLGMWVITPAEQAEIDAHETACMAAHTEGIAARGDMALLQAALDYEGAQQRLLKPIVTEPETVPGEIEGELVPNPAIALDAQQRAAAQAVLDAAGSDTLALVALRAPVPELVPEDDQAAVA